MSRVRLQVHLPICLSPNPFSVTMKQNPRSAQSEKEAIQDFEDVLHHIGGWGRFQKTLGLYSIEKMWLDLAPLEPWPTHGNCPKCIPKPSNILTL